MSTACLRINDTIDHMGTEVWNVVERFMVARYLPQGTLKSKAFKASRLPNLNAFSSHEETQGSEPSHGVTSTTWAGADRGGVPLRDGNGNGDSQAETGESESTRREHLTPQPRHLLQILVNR